MKITVLCFIFVGVWLNMTFVLGENFEYECDILEKLNSLDNKMKVSEEVNADLQRKVKASEAEIADLQSKMAKVEDINDALTKQLEVQPKVGFTATGTKKEYYIKDETIIFTKVITNDGNGYDPESGVFTCPTSGVFLFALAVATYGNHSAYAAIKANGDTVVRALSESQADSHDIQSSNLAILRLQEGVRVWVSTIYANNKFSSREGSTTFSGVYLYA